MPAGLRSRGNTTLGERARKGSRIAVDYACFQPKTAGFSRLTGMRRALLASLRAMRTGLCMESFVYTELQPVKTMKQFISDRRLYRTLILALLVMNWCF